MFSSAIVATVRSMVACLVSLIIGIKADADPHMPRMVFTSCDHRNLVVANEDGSYPRAVQRSGSFCMYPRWSPDGITLQAAIMIRI